MWTATGAYLLTWLKVTVVLGVLVLVTGFVWGFGSTEFTAAIIAAIVLDLITIRGLVRAWVFDARGSWWWLG